MKNRLRYTIIENGRKLHGEIVKIDEGGYHIRWSDGEVTTETKPDPMRVSPWVDAITQPSHP
jgi:hypothetical protein